MSLIAGLGCNNEFTVCALLQQQVRTVGLHFYQCFHSERTSPNPSSGDS